MRDVDGYRAVVYARVLNRTASTSIPDLATCLIVVESLQLLVAQELPVEYTHGELELVYGQMRTIETKKYGQLKFS